MTVWLAQCLCPDRHCILAAASEAEGAGEAWEKIVAPLRRLVEGGLRTFTINPWCGLCNARPDTWRYEIRQTVYRTIAEAEPLLRQLEAEQRATASVFGDLHRGKPN